MGYRKYLREMVRRQAEVRGIKTSKAVHSWRVLLNVYPGFHGEKQQKKGSRQRVLVYPVPRGANRNG